MSESVLRTKAMEFAKAIILLLKEMQAVKAPSALTNQLLRSGTSIGANIYEAGYIQGKADFISKLEISLKECYETEYWLSLLFSTSYISEEIYNELSQQCGAIRRMLIASVKTVKEKARQADKK